MSRIFLDVGAHNGQTIELLLSPRFKVDHIFGFEPSPVCLEILRKKFGNNQKITICDFGLYSDSKQMTLFNSGSQGGTIWDDYQTTCNPEKREDICKFVRASDWFKDNLSKADEIFLKLNCEGSECDIISDLLSTGEYDKIKAVLIDFDVRKSPSQEYKEMDLRKQLIEKNINNVHVYMGDNRHMILFSVMQQR